MHFRSLRHGLAIEALSTSAPTVFICLGALAASGCQQLPPHSTEPTVPAHWDAPSSRLEAAQKSIPPEKPWWVLMNDPAINSLVDATLTDNPDLMQAMAQIDAAAAAAGEAASAGRPQMTGGALGSRGSGQVSTDSSVTRVGSVGTATINFAWEIDLFGRIRAQREAARQRLNARTADAAGVRTALVANVASQVVEWRSCNYLLQAQRWEVYSLQETLRLVRKRLAAGAVAVIDESRSVHDVDTSLAKEQTLQETCSRSLNSIVVLSGLEADRVRSELARPLWNGIKACALGDAEFHCDRANITAGEAVIPSVPEVAIAIPATVLAESPAVLSAQREIAAALADVDAVRASRYPRLDLSSLLTGQWLAIGGRTINFATWSVGAALSAPIYDGGLQQSQFDGSEARYRQAVAKGVSVVRMSVQDIENALTSLDATKRRSIANQGAVGAAQKTLRLDQRKWQEGATGLLELEDSRRQYALAARDAVVSEKEHSQAWIALVRATGNNAIAFTSISQEN